MGAPTQTGELELALTAAGLFTTKEAVCTVVEPQPGELITTEYLPALNAEAGVTMGCANAEVKPFGPVQAKVNPVRSVAVRFKTPPTQTGLLLFMAKLPKLLPTTTVVVAVKAPQEGVVAVSV
jgi:hypothetical protein